MPVKPISPEEIAEKGMETRVWYVINETQDHILGFPPAVEKGQEDSRLPPWNDSYERVTPVFLEKEDAETLKFIASKQAYLQNDKLDVESEGYRDIRERVAGHPEFTLQMFDSERAKQWFKDYEDILRTRKFEEARKLISESEEDNFSE